MKQLFVLRHAKSSWTDSSLSDFERPLNDRGLNAAPFMGELIARKNLLPDIILSSPAKRAVHTATLIKESSGANAEIRYDERIYEASPHTLRQIVAELDDAFGSAMIVGHNPGIEGFIRYVTGKFEPMPTASLAVIEFKKDKWCKIDADSGKVLNVFRPKDEIRAIGTGSD